MVAVNSSGDIETFKHGVTRSVTADGAITIIRTKGNMSHDGVNTWASLLALTMQEWKSNRPLAILQDLTSPNQGFTPYVRQRTLDVVKQRPANLTVYSAVVLPDTFIRRIIDMFIRTPVFRQDGLQVRIFGDEATATAWLRAKLADS